MIGYNAMYVCLFCNIFWKLRVMGDLKPKGGKCPESTREFVMGRVLPHSHFRVSKGALASPKGMGGGIRLAEPITNN